MQFPQAANQAPPADAETLKRRAALYLKINRVTVAMKRVPKSGYNAFHKYAYATESDLIDALRAELDTVQIAILPPRVLDFEVIERQKKSGGSDFITRVMIEYGIADCETGELISTVLISEGSDGVDKGFYKAYSGGFKYFLLKSFMVATGDDPEQAEVSPAPAEPATLRAGLLTSLKAAIAAVPAERKPKLTKTQVDAMTDHDIMLLLATLLTVSPVEDTTNG